MAVIKNSESNPLSKRHDRYIVDLKKDSEEKPKYSDMGKCFFLTDKYDNSNKEVD